MKPLAVTSARILAEKALGHPCDQLCVDWAISMLAEGRDGEYLTRLAGMLPPYNGFEIEELRDLALREQGISDCNADEAVRAFTVQELKMMLAGDADLSSTLESIRHYYFVNHYQAELIDFYWLRGAYLELQDDDYAYCWPGASRHNIETIVRDRAAQYVCDVEAGDEPRLNSSRCPTNAAEASHKVEFLSSPKIDWIAERIKLAIRRFLRRDNR